MGSSQSTNEIGAGFRIFKVLRNSPAECAGLEMFFDYIVEIDGIPLNSLNADNQQLFFTKIRDSVDKQIKLNVFNVRTQSLRDVFVIPKQWGINGFLGATVRHDLFENALTQGIRVLEVFENSPAAFAGLVPYHDYILTYNDIVFKDLDELVDVVTANLNRQLQIFVYNSVNETIREVHLFPNHNWGGEGCLGCDIGTGYLHRIPFSRCYLNRSLTLAKSGRMFENSMLKGVPQKTQTQEQSVHNNTSLMAVNNENIAQNYTPLYSTSLPQTSVSLSNTAAFSNYNTAAFSNYNTASSTWKNSDDRHLKMESEMLQAKYNNLSSSRQSSTFPPHPSSSMVFGEMSESKAFNSDALNNCTYNAQNILNSSPNYINNSSYGNINNISNSHFLASSFQTHSSYAKYLTNSKNDIGMAYQQIIGRHTKEGTDVMQSQCMNNNGVYGMNSGCSVIVDVNRSGSGVLASSFSSMIPQYAPTKQQMPQSNSQCNNMIGGAQVSSAEEGALEANESKMQQSNGKLGSCGLLCGSSSNSGGGCAFQAFGAQQALQQFVHSSGGGGGAMPPPQGHGHLPSSEEVVPIVEPKNVPDLSNKTPFSATHINSSNNSKAHIANQPLEDESNSNMHIQTSNSAMQLPSSTVNANLTSSNNQQKKSLIYSIANDGRSKSHHAVIPNINNSSIPDTVLYPVEVQQQSSTLLNVSNAIPQSLSPFKIFSGGQNEKTNASKVLQNFTSNNNALKFQQQNDAADNNVLSSVLLHQEPTNIPGVIYFTR